MRSQEQRQALPIFFQLRSSERFIGLVIGFAIFTDLFLYGLVVPVLPYALTQRFQVSEDQVLHKTSVLLAIYAAGLLIACPVVGWFADRSQARRTPLLLGLVALLGSTLMFTLGRTYPLLVVARLLQGISAAVVWTVGLALMVDTVGPDRLGAAMGAVSIFMSVGAALGPVIGGIVYEEGGYYAPFYMAFGFILLDILLRLFIIEKKTAGMYLQASNDDPPQIELTEAAPPHEEPASRSSKKTVIRVPAIVRLLLSPRLLTGCWIGFVAALFLSSFDAVLPLYLKQIWSFSSLGSGLVYGSLVLPTFVVSPIAGWWVDTRGTKSICVLGLLLEIPLLIALRFPNGTAPRVGQVVEMCFILALNSFGLSFIMTASMTEIALSPGLGGKNGALAQAYALFNMSFSAGTLVGPLISSSIQEKTDWATMCWSLALFSAVSVPPCLLYTGGTSFRDTHWIRARPKEACREEDLGSLHNLGEPQSERFDGK